MNFINKNLNFKKYKKPYPYIVFENFLDKDFYKKIYEKFPSIDDFKKHPNKVNRMHFDTSYSEPLYNSLIEKVPAYKKFHNFIYSKKFMDYIIDKFKDDIALEIKNKNLKNIFKYSYHCNPYEVHKILSKKDFSEKSKETVLYPRLDIGAGLKGYGKINGGKGVHVDNPQRLVSILFYVGGYSKINGGEFRVWRKDNNKLKIDNSIKPLPNLMIASLQNNISFHDVNPVLEIEGSRNAFYIAISASSSIWKNIENNHFNENLFLEEIAASGFGELPRKSNDLASGASWEYSQASGTAKSILIGIPRPTFNQKSVRNRITIPFQFSMIFIYGPLVLLN